MVPLAHMEDEPADGSAPDFGFLYSSPLLDTRGEPLALIDHNAECLEVFASLRRSQVGLRAECDVATARSLRRMLTHGVTILHYCGHGVSTPLPPSGGSSCDLHSGGGGGGGRELGRPLATPTLEDLSNVGVAPALPEDEPVASGFSLVLEDGLGGAHLLPAESLGELVAAGGHALQLVFVSACYSVGGGAAFIRAGVPHVVAVKRSERIQDRAACIFAEAFYFGLLRGGKTVQQAFDIGRSAVSSAVGIAEAAAEAAKFVLLPKYGDHDRPMAVEVFAPKRGLPFRDLSADEPRNNLPSFFPLQFFGRHAEWHALLANVSHRHKRLSTILGPAGIGKSTLCLAAAHNCLQRRCVQEG